MSKKDFFASAIGPKVNDDEINKALLEFVRSGKSGRLLKEGDSSQKKEPPINVIPIF